MRICTFAGLCPLIDLPSSSLLRAVPRSADTDAHTLRGWQVYHKIIALLFDYLGIGATALCVCNKVPGTRWRDAYSEFYMWLDDCQISLEMRLEESYIN